MERRRNPGSSWKAIDREPGLEARKLRAWYRKARDVTPVPALRPCRGRGRAGAGNGLSSATRSSFRTSTFS